jgi:hypothetical protein
MEWLGPLSALPNLSTSSEHLPSSLSGPSWIIHSTVPDKPRVHSRQPPRSVHDPQAFVSIRPARSRHRPRNRRKCATAFERCPTASVPLLSSSVHGLPVPTKVQNLRKKRQNHQDTKTPSGKRWSRHVSGRRRSRKDVRSFRDSRSSIPQGVTLLAIKCVAFALPNAFKTTTLRELGA